MKRIPKLILNVELPLDPEMFPNAFYDGAQKPQKNHPKSDQSFDRISDTMMLEPFWSVYAPARPSI